MTQDVTDLGGCLRERLPSHLKSSLGALFPSQSLFLRPDGTSGEPAVWKGANTRVLFNAGHVATRRNYNPGSVRSSAEIGWLGSREHGAAGRHREVWGKDIQGLSRSWRQRLPRQELSPGRARDARGGERGQAAAWWQQLRAAPQHPWDSLLCTHLCSSSPSSSICSPWPCPEPGCFTRQRKSRYFSPPWSISRHYRYWQSFHPLASLVPSHLGL